jgi:hypothetical protein
MDLFRTDIIHKHAKIHGLPSFVKQADVVQQEETIRLPQHAFADAGRKLACHTKAATWLSWLTYHETKMEDKGGLIRASLEKSAAFWGIQAECNALTSLVKQASAPEVPYALVLNHRGQEFKMFPMDGPEAVKKSATHLVASRADLPLDQRKEAAQALLKQAWDSGVPLATCHQLEQMAGLGMSKASDIAPQLELRARMDNVVRDREVCSRYQKMAAALRGVELNADQLEKLAAAIDMADRACGMYQYYGRGVMSPEELCFSTTKSASEALKADQLSLMNGKTISKQALAGLPADRFVALGEDFVSAIASQDGKVDLQKAAELVPTLPMGDANLFVSMMP